MSANKIRKGKAVAAIGVILTVVMLLAGCGSAGSASKAEDGPITLRFSWWGNDLRQQLFEKVIADYERENPGIVIEPSFTDFDPYWDRLATQTAANDAPDVISMDFAYFSEYAQRGALLDLSKHGINAAKFPEQLVATGTVDGELLGLAHGLSAFAILANPAVFDEAGVDLPDDDTWTWDEMLEVSAELSAKGAGGSGLGGRTFAQAGAYNVFLSQRDKGIFTADGAVGFDQADMVAWWDLMRKAQDSKAIGGAAAVTEESALDVDQSGLAEGKFAMDTWWSNQLAGMNSAAGQEMKLLHFPTVDGKPDAATTIYQPTVYWTVSSRTEHPDEAVKFINYFATSPEAAKIIGTDRGLPADADARKSIAADLTPVDQSVVDFLGLDESGNSSTGSAPPPPPAGGSSFGDIYARYTTEVMFGRLTPADAAEKLITEAEQGIQK